MRNYNKKPSEWLRGVRSTTMRTELKLSVRSCWMEFKSRSCACLYVIADLWTEGYSRCFVISTSWVDDGLISSNWAEPYVKTCLSKSIFIFPKHNLCWQRLYFFSPLSTVILSVCMIYLSNTDALMWIPSPSMEQPRTAGKCLIENVSLWYSIRIFSIETDSSESPVCSVCNEIVLVKLK